MLNTEALTAASCLMAEITLKEMNRVLGDMRKEGLSKQERIFFCIETAKFLLTGIFQDVALTALTKESSLDLFDTMVDQVNEVLKKCRERIIKKYDGGWCGDR